MNNCIDLMIRVAELGDMYLGSKEMVNYEPFPENLLSIKFYNRNTNDYFKGFRFGKEKNREFNTLQEWFDNLKDRDCKKFKVQFPTYFLEERFYKSASGISEERFYCVFEGYYEIWNLNIGYQNGYAFAFFEKAKHVVGNLNLEVIDKIQSVRNLMKAYLAFVDYTEKINFSEAGRTSMDALRQLANFIENDIDYSYPDLIKAIGRPFGYEKNWIHYTRMWSIENGCDEECCLIISELYNSIIRCVESIVN